MIQLGNLRLNSPLVIASGPLTDKFSKIKSAQEAGAGAVSLKLTFVEVPFQSQMRSYSIPGSVIISPTNKRLDISGAFDLMKRCKDELSVPMLANFSAVGDAMDDWKLMTERFVEAGTDMLEPNFCCPNLDSSAPTDTEHHDHGGASIGENPEVCRRLISMMREITDRPIIPKIIAADRHVLQGAAKAIEEAGADGIHFVGVPMSGLPPVNDDGRPAIPLLEGVPQGSTNGSVCKYSTFLGIAHLAQVINIPIMASGGLDTWKDCVDAIAWGATSPSICSAIMWRGWEVVEHMNEGIRDYMDRHGYKSIEDFRGIALKHMTTPDKAKLIEGASWVDPEECIGCGRCEKPGHCEAIEMRADGKAFVHDEDCMGCGVCWSLCPTGAISYRVKEEH